MAKQTYKTNSQYVLTEQIERENKLRLKWFVKGKEKLLKHLENECNKPKSDTNEKLRDIRMQLFKKPDNIVKDSEKNVNEPEMVRFDTMKEVDEKVRAVLYNPNSHRNRCEYLKQRYKVLPEDRYYLTETNNFVYGWKMFSHAKEKPCETGYGRIPIVRDTFYRKGGIERDPEHYQTPVVFSPTVCKINTTSCL